MSEVRNQKPEKTTRTGMADRVRAAAESLKVFSKNDLFCHIDQARPLTIKEETGFQNAWDDLMKRGEIERKKTGVYQYHANNRPQYDVLEKIHRAMHIKGAFCAADIRKLTDGDQSYISAVIRRMAKAGELELTGKKGKHKIYRVKNANQFYLKKVRNV